MGTPGQKEMGVMKAIRTLVKRALGVFGCEIRRLPRIDGSSPAYQAVNPAATYSPWNKDAAFIGMYAAIRGFTLVDRYRCFELWRLVEQSSKLPFGNLVEIGVWRGGTGALIAGQAKRCGIADRVFLCDTFTGVVKAGPQDSAYKGGEHHDTTRQVVENLVYKQINLDNVEVMEGVFPDQTGHVIENLQFRFCHIDVDVYQSAKDIDEWIWSKMVHGGIIVYDDYGFQGCDGVTKYVEEQMPYKDRLVIHNLNGHAIVVKL